MLEVTQQEAQKLDCNQRTMEFFGTPLPLGTVTPFDLEQSDLA